MRVLALYGELHSVLVIVMLVPVPNTERIHGLCEHLLCAAGRKSDNSGSANWCLSEFGWLALGLAFVTLATRHHPLASSS